MLSALIPRMNLSAMSRGAYRGISASNCYPFVALVQQQQHQCLERSSQPQQVRYRSNRSRRGLYDGKDIRTGNNVSFSMRHTKRTFKPNVFIKKVYSEILDDMIQFHLTTSTLRSIDKAGGLDNYLMKHEFTEGEGHTIKKKILKRLKNQAYFARKAMEKETDGIVPVPVEQQSNVEV